MSEVVNIPQLRFPEFSGAWEEKKLGEVVRYTKGFAFKSNDYVDSGVRIIRVSDLGAESIKKDNKSIYLSSVNEHLYDKWKIRKNNIVITTVGSNPDLIESAVGRGIFIINDNEGLLNQNMLKLENSSQLNNKFVHCFINSPKYIHHIKAIKRGNANQANITVKELLDFKLSITTKPEQQKIAAFLTAIDNKIEQLSKKQELLDSWKKGLMQQIFSQAIRFKADDGSDFPDWEEKKLGDVAEIVGGGTPPTAVEKYWNGNIQWFTPTEIKSKYIVNSKRTITQVGLDTSSAKLLPKGTLLFSSRATVGEVGIAVQECTTNQGFQSFIVNKNNEPEFLYNWIIKNKKEFIRRASGSTFLEIGKSEIKKIKLHIPALPEQTKIASFLSSIDSKIEQVGKQLDESKQFKKALLQQMFV